MKNKLNQLEESFAKYESENSNFMRDGMLNSNRYNNAKIKIAWILKQDYYDSGAAVDTYFNRLTDCKEKGVISSSPTWRRMSYVSYGLLTGKRDFADFPDASVCADELLATAVIEANKELGDLGSKSTDSIMIEGFNRYKELIHQQLDTYIPDVIIVCLPEPLRCVVNSIYSHFYSCEFQNGLDNVYVDGADVGISQGQKPLFLWPYHPQASKGYLGKGITDHAYTMSILNAYDKVMENTRQHPVYS